MAYNFQNEIEQTVACSKGGKILIKGIRDPNAFGDTILVCPIHQDIIKVPPGLPKRRWIFEKVISEGQESSIFGSQFARNNAPQIKPYTLPSKHQARPYTAEGRS